MPLGIRTWEYDPRSEWYDVWGRVGAWMERMSMYKLLHREFTYLRQGSLLGAGGGQHCIRVACMSTRF